MTRNVKTPAPRSKHVQHTHAATRRHAYLFRTRVESSQPLRDAVGSLSGASTHMGRTSEEAAEGLVNAAVFSRELYSRLVSDAPALDTPQGGALWEPALQRSMNDAVAKLQPSLGGDVDFAALATKGLLAKAAKALPALLEKVEQEEKERQERQANGEPEPEAQPGDVAAGDLLASAMRRAANEVAGEIADTKAALHGLAPGLATAPNRKDEGDPRRLALIERVRDDDDLRRVLRLAGRLQRVHARVRQMKTTDGCTEIHSVEQGGDLDRILADHMALLDDEDLGDWALSQVIERKAMQYSLIGKEPMGRGPIVVLRDISASMDGMPHAWAAAVCILACQVGAKEGRQVTIVNYNRSVVAARKLDTSGKAWDAQNSGNPAPLGGLAEMVLRIASDAVSGGTSMTPALDWAMANGGLVTERADLVIVTDGRADSVRPSTMARLQAMKEAEGLKVAGLTINRGRLYPALAQVCDTVVDLDRGDTARQAASAVTL